MSFEQCPIDGDGRLFRHIVNYLQYGKWLLPANFDEFALLHSEIRRFAFDETAIGLNAAMHALGVLLIAPLLPRLAFRLGPRRPRLRDRRRAEA